MPIKFLTLTTEDEKLNRVQANVGEALRQLEASIGPASVTNITNIYNTTIVTGAAAPATVGEGTWDSVLSGNIVTGSNVATTIIQWGLGINTVETIFSTVIAIEGSLVFDLMGNGGSATIWRASGLAVLQGTSNLWNVSPGGMNATWGVTATAARLQVTGLLNKTVTWRAFARRLVIGK